MAKLDDLKDTTEKTTKALEWLADVLLGKNWVIEFALALVTVGIFCNQTMWRQAT